MNGFTLIWCVVTAVSSSPLWSAYVAARREAAASEPHVTRALSQWQAAAYTMIKTDGVHIADEVLEQGVRLGVVGEVSGECGAVSHPVQAVHNDYHYGVCGGEAYQIPKKNRKPNYTYVDLGEKGKIIITTSRTRNRSGKPLYAQESPGGWKREETAKTGVWKVLVIPVEFPDVTGWPISHAAPMDPAKYQALYGAGGTVDAFYNESSGGKLRMTAEVAPLTMSPQPTSTYLSATYGFLNVMLDDVLVALTASGTDVYSYDNWVVSTSEIPGVSYAGLGHVGYKGLHINGADSTGTACHEIGHNLGRGHAHSQRPYYDYGSRLDVMGIGGGSNPVFGTHAKVGFNWVDGVCDVVSSGAVSESLRLYRHDHYGAGGHRAVRMGWGWHQRYYWLEYRAEQGWGCALSGTSCGDPPYSISSTTSRLQPGLVITEERAFLFTDDSRLVDVTSTTDVRTSPEDVTLPIGQSYTLTYDGDPTGIPYATISVASSGGTSPNEYLDVDIAYVRGGCPFSDDGSPPCSDRCTHHHLDDPDRTSIVLSETIEFATDFVIPTGRTASGVASLAFAAHGSLSSATITIYSDSNGMPGVVLATVDYHSIGLSDSIKIVPSRSDGLGLLELGEGRYWCGVKGVFDNYPVYLLVVKREVGGTPRMERNGGVWIASGGGDDIAFDIAMWCSGVVNDAVSIEVTKQPPNTVDAGEIFEISVRFTDADGTPVSIPSGMTIDVEIGTNPGMGHLSTQHSTTSDGYTKCLTFDIAVDHGGSGYTLTIQGDSLSVTTSVFDVTTITAPATSMAFTGLITTFGEPFTSQHNSVIGNGVPIIILVLNSEGNVDPSAGGLVITATSQGGSGGGLTGNIVTVDNTGKAVFSSLVVTSSSCEEITIKFTADVASMLEVGGKSISTGIITTTPTGADNFEFSTNSLVNNPGIGFNGVAGVKLSPIRLILLNSCGGVDNVTVGVTAQVVGNGVQMDTVEFVNGIAVFDDITYQTVPAVSSQLSFTVSGVTGSITTGDAVIVASTVPAVSLSTNPANLPRSTAVENQLFTVELWLLDDQSHHDTTTSTVTLTAATTTTSSGVVIINTTPVTMLSGTAFVDVTLQRSTATTTQPCPATVTIIFTADSPGNIVDGKTFTMTVSLSGRPADHAVLNTPVFPTSLESGTGLGVPDYTLTLYDSCGVVDDATVGVEVVVSDVGGVVTLTGLGLTCQNRPCFPFSNGVATVRGVHPVGCVASIRFLHSFVHDSNGVYPVLGTSITAASSISMVPVEGYAVRFTPQSFFTTSGEDKTLDGSVIPMVEVVLLNSCGEVSSMGGVHIATSTSTSGVQLLGSSAVTNSNGIAVFSNLTVEGCTVKPFILDFSITPGSGKVSSGHITVNPVRNEALVFLPNSFFTVEMKHKTVTLGSTLPEIVVATVDSCDMPDNHTDVVGTKLIVKSSGGVLQNFESFFSNGVAKLTQLRFINPMPDHDVKLTFRISPVPPTMPRGYLLTGDVTITETVVLAANMIFSESSSHFTAEHLPVSTQRGSTLPRIVILLQDSNHATDAVTNGITITATSADITLSGTTSCTTVSGRCEFDNLQLTSCSSSVILFTAEGDDGVFPVAGHTLHSGEVDVQGGGEVDIVFGSGSYFTNEKEAHTVAVGSAFPTVIILILDSCGVLQEEGVGGMVVTSMEGVLHGDMVRVSNGFARFENLVLEAGVGVQTALVFTYTPDGGGEPLSIVSGVVAFQVAPAIVPSANVVFSQQPGSTVKEEGRPFLAIHETPTRPITIHIQDSAHSLDTTDNTTKIVINFPTTLQTTPSPTTMTALRGVITIPPIIFTQCGSGVMVFTAESSGNPVHGHTLTTGVVTVSGRVGESAALNLEETNIEAGHLSIYSLDSCGVVAAVEGWKVTSSDGSKCTAVHGRCELYNVDTSEAVQLKVDGVEWGLHGVTIDVPARRSERTSTVTLPQDSDDSPMALILFFTILGVLVVAVIGGLLWWRHQAAQRILFTQFVSPDGTLLLGVDAYDKQMEVSTADPEPTPSSDMPSSVGVGRRDFNFNEFIL